MVSLTKPPFGVTSEGWSGRYKLPKGFRFGMFEVAIKFRPIFVDKIKIEVYMQQPATEMLPCLLCL